MLGLGMAPSVTEVVTNDAMKQLIQAILTQEKADHSVNPNTIVVGLIVLVVVVGTIAVLEILRNWKKPPG